MLPELRQDRSALRWIRGELDQTLREARATLEDFVEGEQGRLDTCVDRLHHVHGALEMVQVYGAAMLADEMERLALALSQGQVKRSDSAAEALMLGMVQMPAYLERIEGGGADIPLALLPLMNDLRAARDAPLVSESSLFAPKLNAVIAAETVRPGSGNRNLPHLIHHQRSHFHRGLLNWIRGQDVAASLGQIRDVLDVLNSAAGTARFRRLLDAAEALAAALMDDREEPALAVKPLFGKLDRVFKQVIDQGEESAMLDFPADLLKNLLYYVARSNSNDPAVVAVKRTADLVNTFPEQQVDGVAVGSLGAPDRELFQAVGEALAQDLRDVKDHLDLYIRSDRSQLDRLIALAAPIQRIGDTLGMVGRGELRARLKHRCDELHAIEETAVPPADERLMALAADLLFVESALASLATGGEQEVDFDEPMEGTVSQSLSAGELQQHVRAAIDEALVELAKTKDGILEFLDKPDHPELLNEVPSRLHMVAGVLQMLDLPQAGRLLTDLKPYIAELAEGARTLPDAAQRDALADVIISAELYMQSAIEPGSDRSNLLPYAEAALERLGLRETRAQMPGGVPVSDAEADVSPGAELSTEIPPEVPPEIPPVQEVASFDTAQSGEPVHADIEEQVLDETAETAPPVVEEVAEVDAVDSEILEVFSEEADEELLVIQDCYPKWRDNLEDRECLLTTRRSFHTLKGSGRIVGATNIGEFSWAVENLLNRVIDGTVPWSSAAVQLLDEVVAVLPTLVAESRQPGLPGTDVSALSERAFALAAGEPAVAPAVEESTEHAEVEAGAEPDQQVSPIVSGSPQQEPEPEDAPTLESVEPRAEPLGDLAAFSAAESWGGESQPATHLEAGASPDAQPEEAGGEPRDDESGEYPPFDMPSRESADVAERTGEVEPLEATAGLEFGPQAGSGQEADTGPPLGDAYAPESGHPLEASDAVAAGSGAEPAADHDIGDESILTAAVLQDSEFSEIESASPGGADSSLNAVFQNEAQGHINVLGNFIARCRGHHGGCVFDDGVRRAMHTLRGSSRTAGAESIAELAGALEEFGNAMYGQHRQADSSVLDLLERSHESLVQLALAVEDPHLEVPGWIGLRDEINGLTQDLIHPAAYAPTMDGGGEIPEAVDPELLEVFLDEAKELLEALDGELADWEESVDDQMPVARLQRSLHTMKGGARLCGLSAVGDLSHAMESVFESVAERRVDSSERLKGLVRHASDALAQDIDKLIGGGMPVGHPAMVERLEAAAEGRQWDEVAAAEASIEPEQPAQANREWAIETESQLDFETVDAASEMAADDSLGADSELLRDSQLMTDSELLDDSGFLTEGMPAAAELGPVGAVVSRDSTVVQFPSGEQVLEDDGFVPRRPLPEEPPAPAVGSERVRVSSEALDHMVNNAGEVSIYRARIEQQNSSFEFNLGELRQTIDRLRGQLRGLEIETEAQILSRHERDGETWADFDPLEMDRYSTIQQLSRALSETVEDLSNLGQSLNDLSRDTDTLLLQQARVTTDLQDSLLRTRMVKFSSRVPRLERVVRQTSHSVGKQANLEVVGGEEDMDRAILERMMSPLEHLLRNAVSHGIEDANTRLANGKAAQGLITLHLAREGTDVVLTLSDDGAGLDRARIRAKAVERGLIAPDAAVEDDDLYQLILQPGFSTAQELSQVSGRGVGMDVVLTEVKQLGGTLEIDSQPGRGSSFTIRLPFTLAITDALLVTLGDDIYAVPHSSMDGVVRIPVDELRAIYSGERESFEYGGRNYALRYLGNMLGTLAPHLSEGARWLPLLLVRSGDHRIAIQVDGLLGNRQIVVKSIGAQLSTVRWFTGGTILADGQIALILDTNSLVRMDNTQQVTLESAAPMSKGVSVMVVDDSITVRKVTSRLLERHNMQVVTAKDGVDAVTLLQEHHPDVMLLDIEMPRMDGYELARHMRSTAELADIPIIMITSRTGDKHRKRALELGVKHYLGKPYQEAELLENIYTVLAEMAL